MSAIPNYVSKPDIGAGTCSTANTNRDGTGTIATLLTAAAAGTRVDRIVVTAQGTTAAGMLRLFVKNAAGSFFLRNEIPVTAITPGATTQAFTSTVTISNGLFLPSGWGIGAAPHNAETYTLSVEGGDL